MRKIRLPRLTEEQKDWFDIGQMALVALLFLVVFIIAKYH